MPVIGGDFFHQVGDNVGKAGFLSNWAGTGPAHFDAVIFRGVVGGGEHGAGNIPIPGDEIQLVGAGEPEEYHVHSLGQHAIGECSGQFR